LQLHVNFQTDDRLKLCFHTSIAQR
jgi:hypothetical protein